MTTKIYYRSSLDISRDYVLLYLTVYLSESSDTDFDKGTLKFKFQANMSEDKANLDNWYGGSLEIECRHYDSIGKLASLAKRLLDKDKYGMALADVLASLEAKGSEVTYDGRLSQNVPLAEVLPVEYKRYLDKPSYPKYGCLARSEEEAEGKMIEKAVENKDFDYVTSFVQGGKQVYLSNGINGRGLPETEDIRTRISKL